MLYCGIERSYRVIATGSGSALILSTLRKSSWTKATRSESESFETFRFKAPPTNVVNNTLPSGARFGKRLLLNTHPKIDKPSWGTARKPNPLIGVRTAPSSYDRHTIASRGYEISPSSVESSTDIDLVSSDAAQAGVPITTRLHSIASGRSPRE